MAWRSATVVAGGNHESLLAAQAIIEAARQNNLDINLIRETGVPGGPVDSYNQNDKSISWDSFRAVTGFNYDNSRYIETPTMSLMHEIAHSVFPNLTEAEIMNIVNGVANEINQKTGSSYDTHRDRHSNGRTYDVNDTDSGDEGTRPACN